MALIVEDGSGLANAESLCSVAAATAYHASLGNDAWAALASDTKREQLLRQATIHMESTFGQRWAGYRKSIAQSLSWPRYEVPLLGFNGAVYVDSTSVPRLVANACAELALRASAAPLAPDVDRLKKRTKVDTIEVEYESGGVPYTRFRAVDLMLEPLLCGGGSMLTVVRS